jgi:hypothetical protein
MSITHLWLLLELLARGMYVFVTHNWVEALLMEGAVATLEITQQNVIGCLR